jgi:hypothetical protein
MRFNVACLKIVAAVLAAALVSACGSDANSLAIQSFALTPNPLTLPANGDGVLRIDYKIDAGVHNGAVWIVPKDTPDDLVATSFAIHSIDCNSAACFNADVTVTCSYRIAPADASRRVLDCPDANPPSTYTPGVYRWVLRAGSAGSTLTPAGVSEQRDGTIELR